MVTEHMFCFTPGVQCAVRMARPSHAEEPGSFTNRVETAGPGFFFADATGLDWWGSGSRR